MEPEPKYFATAAKFRAWLEAHHDREQELWVGFCKRDSGLASLTWPESVDQALCFGWIDGVRKSVDDARYKIRFTPRKPGSKWSAINTRRAQELSEGGMMHPAGLKALAQRTGERSGIYAYEQRHLIELEEAQEKQFRRSKEGWQFFQAQPNWYRKTALWWVVSAKREETRAKRMSELIECSEQGKTIRPLTRTSKP
jgi:uncharacterized protein YdeI (YjbR/CyaY-like superfamily)